MRETIRWPFVKAKYFTAVPPGERKVRLIVIHAMEAPEGPQTAENVAAWFSRGGDRNSAHLCIDSNSIIQCVWDRDVAWAAPGANHDGIQLELTGYSRQTLAEWMDDYSVRLLRHAADAAAQYCLKFELQPRWLTDAELRRGRAGIVGHNQVSRVYGRSGHTDPGIFFPAGMFVEMVKNFIRIRTSR